MHLVSTHILFINTLNPTVKIKVMTPEMKSGEIWFTVLRMSLSPLI